MNIGFFTDAYTPLVDGVVKSIILYKDALEKMGHRVYVFAPQKVKSKSPVKYNWDFEDDERTFRFKAVDSVFIPGYPLSIPISFKASKKIPQLNLDIVHCHTPVTMGMLGDIVALLQNIPKVYTYHTFYPEYADHYIKLGKFKTREAVKKFDIFYCNRSDRVIVPSNKLEKILREWGVKSKIETLPTGIDPAEFKNANPKSFRKKVRVNDGTKLLLFVGRLGSEKNVGFLLDVMKNLSGINHDLKLVVAGDGKYRKELEKKVKVLEIEDKVIFTGILKRNDTINAFSACDIFVFASKTDTQGLVLLEAAYMGKPIVMIEDPGLGSVVADDKNGFLVPEDVGIFAKKINLLLNDDDLYDSMSANSKKIAAGFTIENQSEKLLNLYQEVVSHYQSKSIRVKFWQGLNKEIKIPEKLKINKDSLTKIFKKNKNIFKIN